MIPPNGIHEKYLVKRMSRYPLGVASGLLLPECRQRSSSSSSDTVQGSVALSHTGDFRVGGGVHDSYTFQCGLVGSFTSPGIDTR